MSGAAVSSSERLLHRLPIAPDRPLLGYGVATSLVLLATAVRFAAAGALPPGFPFVTFFPAVALSAFFFGIGPGVFAAVMSGLVAGYWFISPDGFSFDRGSSVAILFYSLVVLIELVLIHLMQLANGRLARAREHNVRLAATSELLFRELQHRVSNNLQVAAALLGLQRQKLSDNDARQALDEAARRLALIGRISRTLYDPTGEAVSLQSFLTMLLGDLIDAHGRPDIAHAVRCPAETRLKPDDAVPVALIVAEAVSNAIEHGIGPRTDGRLEVSVDVDGEMLRIEIADNGSGVPAGFDLADADSLGLRIATTLARQLSGRFELAQGVGPDGGALAMLVIPR